MAHQLKDFSYSRKPKEQDSVWLENIFAQNVTLANSLWLKTCPSFLFLSLFFFRKKYASMVRDLFHSAEESLLDDALLNPQWTEEQSAVGGKTRWSMHFNVYAAPVNYTLILMETLLAQS